MLILFIGLFWVAESEFLINYLNFQQYENGNTVDLTLDF